MDIKYGYDFFNDFYEQNGGGNYTKKEQWKPFFEGIAQNIVDKFNPTTVLDAGCAMGYLVEALRKNGVEAYGFDISEYAISNVAEEAKPYCFVHSITEELPDNIPQKFDLIVTIEVLEHLFPEEGSKAIKNLCRYSDTIIFTSTPSDIEDLTHVNVQQAEYWCKEFAKNSFFRDYVLPVNFICEHAMLFRKKTDFENVIFDYELYNRVRDIKDRSFIDNLTAQNEELNVDIATLKEKITNLENINEEIEKECNKANKDLKVIINKYNLMVNSRWWKAIKPMRVAGTGLKRILKLSGISQKNGLKMRKFAVTSGAELNKQRQTKFDKDVKFSVLVPLYNTPPEFLKEMIDSVKAQTYSNWELCLTDGSDESHNYVETICQKYAKSDSRIKYKKLEKNLGISENTNECIKMAIGDYISLFDHDDVLHPSALFETVKAVNEQNADFIYTDEATFEGTLKNIVLINFKPDFAIDYLRSNNYICHFTTVKKDLLDEVGMFRSEFNGSQDHDMLLRLTEKTKNIVHIPKVLYYWRKHKDSVSSDSGAKPYATEAGIKAVSEHLNRCNLQGKVESSKVISTIYRIKYKIEGNPLISILISNKDHVRDLNKCIKSIIEKSTYKNYEIIIIENNSEKEETFEYYKSLEPNEKIKVVEYKGDFNYSSINNFGAKFANGEHIILLNNDIEVIAENWIEEMLMYSQRKDVGIVGAKLYYQDDTLQHGGVILGLGKGIDKVAGHSHKNCSCHHVGYMGRLSMPQDLSAVTGACLMISKQIFDEVGGLDEELFAVAFNDVDLCMRVRKLGYLVVWTPYAELYHHESKSRGNEDTPQKVKRFNKEVKNFQERWKKELEAGDPYYNPNLTLEKEDFSIK